MTLPQTAIKELSPVACYPEKKGNTKLLCLSRGDSPLPNPSTCGHCLLLATPHPASSPLVSLLPGNQQLKMQPLKPLSALPALVWPPVPSPQSQNRTNTQYLTLKPGIMPQLRGAETSGSGGSSRAWGQELEK